MIATPSDRDITRADARPQTNNVRGARRVAYILKGILAASPPEEIDVAAPVAL